MLCGCVQTIYISRIHRLLPSRPSRVRTVELKGLLKTPHLHCGVHPNLHWDLPTFCTAMQFTPSCTPRRFFCCPSARVRPNALFICFCRSYVFFPKSRGYSPIHFFCPSVGGLPHFINCFCVHFFYFVFCCYFRKVIRAEVQRFPYLFIFCS